MEQNANPLKSQYAHRRGMAFARSPQALMQGFGPTTRFAGMIGKFMEALTQKLRTGPAPMHPALFAALLGDRGNARQLLNLLGGLKAIPIRTEGRQQARGQDCARSRKTFKQGTIGMLSKNRCNLAVEPLDGVQQRERARPALGPSSSSTTPRPGR